MVNKGIVMASVFDDEPRRVKERRIGVGGFEGCEEYERDGIEQIWWISI